MSMKVEGTKHFDAPQAKVWEVLNDPSRMARTMPGVKDFSVQDDRHWTAKVVIPLGLGGLKMSINFEKVEERAPDYARLNAKGTGVGAMLNMDTQFELSESGGGTEMKWEADVRLMGQVGSMGQRVLQPIVNQQVQNVLAALEEQVREAADHAPPLSADGSTAAEEGIHRESPQAYSADAGPTQSPQD
jgi:carbon monoxide dehydrogenase subunit G